MKSSEEELVPGRDQRQPPDELHYVQATRPAFVENFNNGGVVRMDGNGLPGPVASPQDRRDDHGVQLVNSRGLVQRGELDRPSPSEPVVTEDGAETLRRGGIVYN